MGSELLEAIGDEGWSRLLAQARRRRFRRGEVIFHEGDPGDTLHILDSGHVAVRRTTPLGDVGTLLVLGPGSLFGELAGLAPAARNATVICLGKVETIAVPHSVFTELREADPRVDRLLVELLTIEVRRLSEALIEALYLPAEQRFYRRLHDLAATFGSGVDGQVVVPLTQEELGQLVGASRPTTNRLLKQAEASGLLSLERGSLCILDTAGVGRRASLP